MTAVSAATQTACYIQWSDRNMETIDMIFDLLYGSVVLYSLDGAVFPRQSGSAQGSEEACESWVEFLLLPQRLEEEERCAG